MNLIMQGIHGHVAIVVYQNRGTACRAVQLLGLDQIVKDNDPPLTLIISAPDWDEEGYIRQLQAIPSMSEESATLDTGVVEHDDVLAGLARGYLFEDLTIDELRPLAASCRTRRLTRDETLIRVGKRAEEIYVVLSGELKDSVVDADGSVVVHFLHGPGMTFGEPGYFAVDRHRIVEVIATEPSVVVRLARRELAPFMAQHPSTKDRVLEKLAANQRWQTTMISSLATRPLVDRLVLRLIELADSRPDRALGPPVTPRISQATLASMIGVSRQNVNRALATLTASGAVRREEGRYVLVAEDRLRRQVMDGAGPVAERRDHRSDGDLSRDGGNPPAV